jgi:hypothetical protein
LQSKCSYFLWIMQQLTPLFIAIYAIFVIFYSFEMIGHWQAIKKKEIAHCVEQSP